MELDSKDRAKTAQQAKADKPLKYLDYTSIYRGFGRQYLPIAAPGGKILPGKFRLSSNDSTNLTLKKEMPDGP
ncbi:MAG TPA: hypothetical protein VNZ85_04925 [Caulobacter sp.]|nr:hypothetical protein [Caulobacter sp.]